MPDDLLNRVLWVLGLGTLGTVGAFGPSWAEAGWVLRVVLVAAFAAAVAGIALDVRDRRRA